MGEALAFAAISSSALVIGATAGAYWTPPRALLGAALAFASGALITALAFDLFEEAYHLGGAARSAIGLFAGATTFVIADEWLERRTQRRAAPGGALGFALLAGVTLDGIPENAALGVSLVEEASLALLLAIFASNLPEALGGAVKMREGGSEPRHVIALWSATAVLLALALLVGYAALDGVSGETLSFPLSFAGGAVLASLANTLMPEAFKEAGPVTAWATALGFLMSFLASVA